MLVMFDSVLFHSTKDKAILEHFHISLVCDCEILLFVISFFLFLGQLLFVISCSFVCMCCVRGLHVMCKTKQYQLCIFFWTKSIVYVRDKSTEVRAMFENKTSRCYLPSAFNKIIICFQNSMPSPTTKKTKPKFLSPKYNYSYIVRTQTVFSFNSSALLNCLRFATT